MRVVQRLPRERQLEGNLQAAPVKGGCQGLSMHPATRGRRREGALLIYTGTIIANFKIEIFDTCNLYERLSPILI